MSDQEIDLIFNIVPGTLMIAMGLVIGWYLIQDHFI